MSLIGVGGLFMLLKTFGYPVEKIPFMIVGYGFGASFVALFAQLGGGIYTKAADVACKAPPRVREGETVTGQELLCLPLGHLGRLDADQECALRLGEGGEEIGHLVVGGGSLGTGLALRPNPAYVRPHYWQPNARLLHTSRR